MGSTIYENDFGHIYFSQDNHMGPSDVESETDVDSREIDYPDASDVDWSSDEDAPVVSLRDTIPPEDYAPFTYTPRRNRTLDCQVVNMTKHRANKNTECLGAAVKVRPRLHVGWDCPICLGDTRSDVDTHVYCSSVCGNVLHRSCMLTYINKRHTQPPTKGRMETKCPICRSNSVFLQVHGRCVDRI